MQQIIVPAKGFDATGQDPDANHGHHAQLWAA
jgi:hypothetical protein